MTHVGAELNVGEEQAYAQVLRAIIGGLSCQGEVKLPGVCLSWLIRVD